MITESKRKYSRNEYGIIRPEPLNYHPIRKKLNFDPQPVAGNIPFYADTVKNPSCLGTSACMEFWDEQFEYCKTGYITAGVYIPGPYYYFLNFAILNGLFGLQYPFFSDMQFEYHYATEWIKKNNWLGIIAPKARRKGLSEMLQCILNHGVRFIPSYKAGICAGLSGYVTGFRTKFDTLNTEIRPELALTELESNDKKILFGYRVRNEFNNIVDDGILTQVRLETMFDNPKKLEGEYFNDVACEESGEFPMLDRVVESIKPAMMMGSVMLGMFHIFGTGGNILSSSRAFKDMYAESESLKLLRFEVTGQRMTYPFLGISDKTIKRYAESGNHPKIVPQIPNFLKAGWKPYEAVGCCDTEEAEKWIIEEDQRYQAMNNSKKLRDHRQNFPRTVEDIFTSAGVNGFDSENLYYALNVCMQTDPLYEPVVLEFKKTKDRSGFEIIKFPFEITRRPPKDNEKSWKIGYILKGVRIDETLKCDYGGTDAFEADATVSSKSKMGICVLRDFRKTPRECPFDRIGLFPVFFYYDRPPKRDQAFEMSLKAAFLFGLKRRMMLSAEHESCLEFYKKNYGSKFLAVRPKSMDSKNDQQIHKYGMKMTSYSKPRTLGLGYSYTEEYGKSLRFEMLIRDMLAYDAENIGTDWDLADAFMLALVLFHDRIRRIDEEADEEDQELEKNSIAHHDGLRYSYNEKGELISFTLTPRTKRGKIDKPVEDIPDYIVV